VAVLSDSERTLKVGVASPHLIPRIAICDPELTLTCPPGLTAVAGADALCHAIEAFTALRRPETPRLALDHVFVGKNALGDVHALSAIRLLSEGLAAAVEDGSNRQARTAVMLGALQAGYAFGTAGTAAAHALQYPIGALTDTAHGLGVALLLPYVMEFNRPAATEELAAVALAMGAPPASPEALARAAIDRVETLFRRIGIPGTLAGIGLDPTRMDWIAEQAATAARLVKNNPRPLAVEDLKQIAQAAYDGRRDGLGVMPTGAEAAR
jgi:alcohol dehydrogenase